MEAIYALAIGFKSLREECVNTLHGIIGVVKHKISASEIKIIEVTEQRIALLV
jgi:hypothetical protein